MVPTTWRGCRREDDNELLGYVDSDQDTFQVRMIFGYPVGTQSTEEGAERALESVGLGYLAERWLLSIEGRDDPITVQIVEATPNEVTVKSVDYGYEGDYGTPFILDVPTSPNQLRPERALP